MPGTQIVTMDHADNSFGKAPPQWQIYNVEGKLADSNNHIDANGTGWSVVNNAGTNPQTVTVQWSGEPACESYTVWWCHGPVQFMVYKMSKGTLVIGAG